MIKILETLFRQATNLQLAVFSQGADLAEEQLASLLNTLHVLVAALPSLPSEVLKPIFCAFAAVDALPYEALPPSARVMEATLLGFASIAAAQFQVNALRCKFPIQNWLQYQIAIYHWRSAAYDICPENLHCSMPACRSP